MAHAAIAYAKANFRRRMMACTTSIGPGATNLVTAAALAHVNRLPVLFLPGDVFISRAPDPVLQQVEDFERRHDQRQRLLPSRVALLRPHRASGAAAVGAAAGGARADRSRAVRSGDARAAAGRADDGVRLSGGVLRAGARDVRRAARRRPTRSPRPRRSCATAKRPLIVAGGGVLYGFATDALRAFAEAHGVPVAETQAGKGALPWDHPLQQGAIGVTGSPAANALAAKPTSCSRSARACPTSRRARIRCSAQARLVNLNVNAFDARKWRGVELIGDAKLGLQALTQALAGLAQRSRLGRIARAARRDGWRDDVARLTGQRDVDAALRRRRDRRRAALGEGLDDARHRRLRGGHAAGGAAQALAHVGARRLSHGVRLLVHGLRDRRRPRREDGEARPRSDRDGRRRQLPHAQLRDRDVGDARPQARSSSCSTIAATAASTACSRRSAACRSTTCFDDCVQGPGAPRIDFAAHAASMGALAENVKTIPELEAALARARAADRTYVICIDTDPAHTTERGRLLVGGRGARSVGARGSAQGARGVRGRQAKTTAMNVKIGINPISWSNDDLPSLGGETPLETALSEGKQHRLPGLRARQQVSARVGGAAQGAVGARPRARVRLVLGTARARSVEDEIAAVGPHLKLLADNGAKVMVYGEVADSIQGAPQPLYKRPRFFTAAQWDAYADRLTQFAKHTLAHGVRVAYHHHMGAYVRDARRRRRAHGRVGPEVGLLFDSGHMTFAGGDAVDDAAKARQARLPRALQGRAAGRDQARAQPQLELPRIGDQRRVHRARRRRRRLPGADAACCASTATKAGSWSKPSRTRWSRRATSTRTRDSDTLEGIACACHESARQGAAHGPRHRRRSRRSPPDGSTSASRRIAWRRAKRMSFATGQQRGLHRRPARHRHRRRRKGRRGARSAAARACSPTRRRTRCTFPPARTCT